MRIEGGPPGQIWRVVSGSDLRVGFSRSSGGERNGLDFNFGLVEGRAIGRQIVKRVFGHAAHRKIERQLRCSKRPGGQSVAAGGQRSAKNLPPLSVSVQMLMAQSSRLIKTRTGDQRQVVAGLQELKPA